MKQIGKDKVLFIASVKEPDSRDISTKEELCIEVKGNYIPICYDTFSGKIYELPRNMQMEKRKYEKSCMAMIPSYYG